MTEEVQKKFDIDLIEDIPSHMQGASFEELLVWLVCKEYELNGGAVVAIGLGIEDFCVLSRCLGTMARIRWVTDPCPGFIFHGPKSEFVVYAERGRKSQTAALTVRSWP